MRPVAVAVVGRAAVNGVEAAHRTATELLVKAGARARLNPEETAVTLLAFTRPELYTEQLALRRTADQYEGWLADVLIASLLHPNTRYAR